MEPVKINMAGLFGGDTQYKIPLFQRHYVWEKEEQWEPLWEDIENIAKKRTEQQNWEPFPHFTGAIITQQKTTAANQVNVYEIIDGQQRLITFQVVLCAIRDVCKKYESGQFPDIVSEIDGKYTMNTGLNINGDARFKLFPNEYDRNAFKSMICPDNGFENEDGHESKINESYNYFKRKIEKFVDKKDKNAEALLVSVIKDFNIVQIDVQGQDEPEIIFQSLNGKGRLLLQFDLLRNDLFLRMRQQENENKDELYKTYWNRFESSKWGGDITEEFLQHFLMFKLATEKVSPLFRNYQKYRKDIKNETIEDELKELKKCAKNYEYIASISSDNNEFGKNVGKEMGFYKDILEITTLRPFVLYLLSDSNLSQKHILYVLRALESYVIRRVICINNPMVRFNRSFATIIGTLIGKNTPMFPPNVDVRMVLEQLSKSKSDTEKWPGNEDVYQSVLGNTGNWKKMAESSKSSVRYILHKIEKYMRDNNKFNDGGDISKDLTLEHIMPQKWWAKWALPDNVKRKDIISQEYKDKYPDWENSPLENEPKNFILADKSYESALDINIERDNLIHSIGNLTLISHIANSSLSNNTFFDKTSETKKYTLLELNREINEEGNWDIQEIKDRTKRLHKMFCKIWPDSQWFLNNIPPE